MESHPAKFTETNCGSRLRLQNEEEEECGDESKYGRWIDSCMG